MAGEHAKIRGRPALTERDRLVADLATLVATLDEYRDDLEDVPGVAPIRELARALKPDTEQMFEDGRLLRLGVVGQIKAGKSTLLNLLLFDGREMLPRAATPMTASLTHIVPSDAVGADRAEIDVAYYDPEEWRKIEEHARQYRREQDAGRNPDEFLRASAELVEMAKQLRIDVRDHQDAPSETVAVDRLNETLRSLVGADGKLTPLVKSVEIRCGSGIPDLEIVDTPGLNDPIVSRVQQTKKLLAQCDAVLLLSYAGQFMDSSDVELCARTLPDEGIKECVVIGSKFDSALIDVARDYHRNLQEAAESVERQLGERARAQLEEVRGEKDVLFMSAMCAALGARPFSAWTDVERDVFESLRKSYPEWLDRPENGAINEDTAQNLTVLVGRRDRVDEKVRKIRDDKDRIMQDKVSDYLVQKANAVRGTIEKVIPELEQKREELRSTGIDKLNERKQAVLKSIVEIESQVTDAWSRMITDQIDSLREARGSCRDELYTARRAIGESIVEQPFTRRIKKGSGFLGIGLLVRALIGQSHYEHEPYTKRVMDDVKLQLVMDEAGDKLRTLIDDVFGKLFDHEFVNGAQRKLSRICADLIDNETASETKPAFSRVLRSAVEKVAKQARNAIGTRRPEVTVGSLRLRGDTQDKESAVRQFVNAIGDVINDAFRGAERVVVEIVEKPQKEFLPVVIRDLDNYHERLEQDIKDKTFRTQRYEMAIRDLQQHAKRFARADRRGDR